MADALCGPSNALQDFQKHATRNQPFQQDRLVSRPSPSQDFRSNRGPNTGLVEREFETFAAGHSSFPSAGLTHGRILHNHHFPPPQGQVPAAFAPVSQLPDWAVDFQRMHLSDPSLQAAGTNQSQGCHGDFSRQNGMIAGSIDQGQRAGGAFGGASNVGMSFPGYHSGGEPSYATALQLQSRHAESQQDTDIFDEAAFDRAFENARAQIQRAEEDIQKAKNVQADDAALVHTRVDPNGLVETRYWDDLSLENLGEMKRDANPYSHQHLNNQSSEPPQARSRPTADSQDTKPHDADVDADELAQTAGQLLSSVSNNTTQKFQDSAFLALMRRLRDREVRVEGDRMVEAPTASTSTFSPAPELESSPIAGIRIPADLQDEDLGRSGSKAKVLNMNTITDDDGLDTTRYFPWP